MRRSHHYQLVNELGIAERQRVAGSQLVTCLAAGRGCVPSLGQRVARQVQATARAAHVRYDHRRL